MDALIAGTNENRDVKDPAARSNFDIVNSGYWDLMRQHHWADFVRGPSEELQDSSVFFAPTAALRGASNKVGMYVLEPVLAGGLPGMAVGAGISGSLLAAESTLGGVLPVLKRPATFLRSSLCSRNMISETAYVGATVAAIDYGISLAADRCFGVNSSVAKTLAPNLLGTALETAGVLFCRNPKVGFAAGYIASKVCNSFRA